MIIKLVPKECKCHTPNGTNPAYGKGTVWMCTLCGAQHCLDYGRDGWVWVKLLEQNWLPVPAKTATDDGISASEIASTGTIADASAVTQAPGTLRVYRAPVITRTIGPTCKNCPHATRYHHGDQDVKQPIICALLPGHIVGYWNSNGYPVPKNPKPIEMQPWELIPANCPLPAEAKNF